MENMRTAMVVFLGMMLVFALPTVAFAQNATDDLNQDMDLEPVETPDEPEEPIEEPEEPVEELPEPGITPDSPLWGIDVALDRISLALERDPNKKAAKGLLIAQERLSEIKEMITQNKLDAATKAEGAHGEVMRALRANFRGVTDGDTEGELRIELELEQRISEHSRRVEDLKVQISLNENIPAEQREKIGSVFENLKGQTGEVEIEIQNEKRKTKVRFEQETGEDADVLEIELEQEVEEKLEIERGSRATGQENRGRGR